MGIIREGLFFLGCLTSCHVYGQGVLKSTSDSLPSYENAVSLYNSSTKRQSLLFNGSEYKESDVEAQGHPYFGNEYMEEGSIHYEDELYSHIPMLYDVVKDRIIIEHYDHTGRGVKLILHEERIKSFSLEGHNFIRISNDSLNNSLKPGFYHLLYDGLVKVLAKRRKTVSETLDQRGVETSYEIKDYYLILRDDVYYSLSGRSSILRILKDKKKLLTQFIREARLDFRNSKEDAIVRTVKYYDTLR